MEVSTHITTLLQHTLTNKFQDYIVSGLLTSDGLGPQSGIIHLFIGVAILWELYNLMTTATTNPENLLVDTVKFAIRIGIVFMMVGIINPRNVIGIKMIGEELSKPPASLREMYAKRGTKLSFDYSPVAGSRKDGTAKKPVYMLHRDVFNWLKMRLSAISFETFQPSVDLAMEANALAAAQSSLTSKIVDLCNLNPAGSKKRKECYQDIYVTRGCSITAKMEYDINSVRAKKVKLKSCVLVVDKLLEEAAENCSSGFMPGSELMCIVETKTASFRSIFTAKYTMNAITYILQFIMGLLVTLLMTALSLISSVSLILLTLFCPFLIVTNTKDEVITSIKTFLSISLVDFLISLFNLIQIVSSVAVSFAMADAIKLVQNLSDGPSKLAVYGIIVFMQGTGLYVVSLLLNMAVLSKLPAIAVDLFNLKISTILSIGDTAISGAKSLVSTGLFLGTALLSKGTSILSGAGAKLVSGAKAGANLKNKSNFADKYKGPLKGRESSPLNQRGTPPTTGLLGSPDKGPSDDSGSKEKKRLNALEEIADNTSQKQPLLGDGRGPSNGGGSPSGLPPSKDPSGPDSSGGGRALRLSDNISKGPSRFSKSENTQGKKSEAIEPTAVFDENGKVLTGDPEENIFNDWQGDKPGEGSSKTDQTYSDNGGKFEGFSGEGWSDNQNKESVFERSERSDPSPGRGGNASSSPSSSEGVNSDYSTPNSSGGNVFDEISKEDDPYEKDNTGSKENKKSDAEILDLRRAKFNKVIGTTSGVIMSMGNIAIAAAFDGADGIGVLKTVGRETQGIANSVSGTAKEISAMDKNFQGDRSKGQDYSNDDSLNKDKIKELKKAPLDKIGEESVGEIWKIINEKNSMNKDGVGIVPASFAVIESFSAVENKSDFLKRKFKGSNGKETTYKKFVGKALNNLSKAKLNDSDTERYRKSEKTVNRFFPKNKRGNLKKSKGSDQQ